MLTQFDLMRRRTASGVCPSSCVNNSKAENEKQGGQWAKGGDFDDEHSDEEGDELIADGPRGTHTPQRLVGRRNGGGNGGGYGEELDDAARRPHPNDDFKCTCTLA